MHCIGSSCADPVPISSPHVPGLPSFPFPQASFPTYRSVLSAAPGHVEESVKIGGLAATKVARIRAILETVLSERPHECLDGKRGHEGDVQGLAWPENAVTPLTCVRALCGMLCMCVLFYILTCGCVYVCAQASRRWSIFGRWRRRPSSGS
jgi:hypothetical protein